MIPSTSFKSKWNSIKTWFSIPDLSKRRPSECSTATTTSCDTDDYSSPMILTPPPQKRPSIMDIKSISPFRKRPSLADIKCTISPFHKQQPCTTKIQLVDIDQVLALYHLALDEFNYAQDSLGSPYYLGDRLAAKEAIENCEQSYDLLLYKQPDLEEKIALLKTKLNSLPLIQEDQISL